MSSAKIEVAAKKKRHVDTRVDAARLEAWATTGAEGFIWSG
jgi:hypothetical protein